MAGAAQRAGEGGQGITGPEGIQQQGGAAHHLVDDGDGSGLGVKIRDGEGDALAVFGGAEDDELAAAHGRPLPGPRGHAADAGGRVSLRRMGAFMERLLPFGGEIGRAPKSRREKTERRKVRKDLLSGCPPKAGGLARGRSCLAARQGTVGAAAWQECGWGACGARPQALEKAKALSDGWIYKQKRAQNKVGRALFAVGRVICESGLWDSAPAILEAVKRKGCRICAMK